MFVFIFQSLCSLEFLCTNTLWTQCVDILARAILNIAFQSSVFFSFFDVYHFFYFPLLIQVCGEKERLATVRGCKWVDEVVENVPYVMSDEYLRWVIGTCEKKI